MLPLAKKLQLMLIALACSLLFALAINSIIARWQRAADLAGNVDFYFYKLFFKPLSSPDHGLLIIDSNDREEKRPRAQYARMLDTLRQAGVSVAACDIRFIGVRDRAGDSALVQSVAQFPRLILSVDFASSHRPSDWALAEMGSLALPSAACDTLIPNIVAESGVDLPFDSLLAVADSRFTYAMGKLVLWSKSPELVQGEGTLRTAKFTKLAIANPRYAAPGGRAAKLIAFLLVLQITVG